jgi:hypothetical protein
MSLKKQFQLKMKQKKKRKKERKKILAKGQDVNEYFYGRYYLKSGASEAR